jgi:serine protease
MRKLWMVVLGLVVAAPLAAGEYRAAQYPAGNGRYIVVFEPGAAQRANPNVAKDVAVASLAHQLAGQARGQVDRVYGAALQGATIHLPNENAARGLARNPNVLLVEQDGRVWSVATQSSPTWGLDRIDQRDLPLSAGYTYNTTASNVNAYIVDTGIRRAHNDFGGRAFTGYDAVTSGGTAEDCNGHGTHVAGTVGGATYGVAKGVRLYAVRVLDCAGSGTNAGVIAGIDWVTANHVKPAVANMSLGGGASSALDTAVNNSIAAGVTYVVAAGNDNANACNYSPARVANAVTVGSTTSSDARSSFSNYGSCLDVFAPGSSITSAWYTSNTATNTISGTSMASPHVAGVAALYLAANTGASPATVANAITSTSTTGKVTSAGTGSPNRLVYSLLSGGGGGEPPPPTDTPLTNGTAVGVSGATGSQQFFYIDVPSGQSNLTVALSGGSGDADLYVSFNTKPTLSSYQCRPYLNGNNETCSFNSPSAGRWWVMLHGYTSFSGASLRATHTASGGGGCSGTSYNGTLSSGQSQYQPNGSYYQSTVSGTHSGVLDGPTGTDFDLYLQKWNGSSWATVKSGTTSSPDESVSYSGTAGYYRWRVHAYSGSGSYTLCTTRP